MAKRSRTVHASDADAEQKEDDALRKADLETSAAWLPFCRALHALNCPGSDKPPNYQEITVAFDKLRRVFSNTSSPTDLVNNAWDIFGPTWPHNAIAKRHFMRAWQSLSQAWLDAMLEHYRATGCTDYQYLLQPRRRDEHQPELHATIERALLARFAPLEDCREALRIIAFGLVPEPQTATTIQPSTFELAGMLAELLRADAEQRVRDAGWKPERSFTAC